MPLPVSHRTLFELRSLLRSRPRYGVDVTLDLAVMSARWPCGCAASGATFARLRLTPCPTHAACDHERRAATEPELCAAR